MNDQVADLRLSYSNMDIYYPRISEVRSIYQNMHLFDGKLLDVGCGQMPYREMILKKSKVIEYVGLDLDTSYGGNIKPDITWDGIKMPIEDGSFNTAISTQVLEHCPEPILLLKEVHRVLKTGGTYYLSVPFLWNLHDVPNDEFRYTPFSLERLLKGAGFCDIEIKATGGWHASLGVMLGSYVCRAPLSHKKRKLAKIVAMPVIKFLFKKAAIEKIDFMKSPMITGLCAVCKKDE